MAFGRRRFPRFSMPRNFTRRRVGGGGGKVRGGWCSKFVGASDIMDLDVPSNTWFAALLFEPLVELADYAHHSIAEPTEAGLPAQFPGGGYGAASLEDRVRINRCQLQCDFFPLAAPDGSGWSWQHAWYLAKFSFQEVANTALLAATESDAVRKYDPLDVSEQWLHRNRIVKFGQTVNIGPTLATATDGAYPKVRLNLNIPMHMQLRTDEEFYLISTASMVQTTEDPPTYLYQGFSRCHITD